MHSPSIFDSVTAHESAWAYFKPIIQEDSLPQAYLMVGPRHLDVRSFVNHFVMSALCQQADLACGGCQMCKLSIAGTHPDVIAIEPETANGFIKIDQIRTLQLDIYQTPQCGNRRFMILDPADKLNQAAANALLKILEEPPSHTTFILIAEHLNLPATVLSRCQKYTFRAPKATTQDPMSIALLYEPSTARAKLYAERLTLITHLNHLVEGSQTPCDIALHWLKYELEDVVWFLYLLTAEAIEYRLLGDRMNGPLSPFAKEQTPVRLFKQMDTISALIIKISQNVALNQNLVLERLLIGYLHVD